MHPLAIYILIVIATQAAFAWMGANAPLRFLLTMVGGVVAIVVFQVLAWLQVGHVDPFIQIAVAIQLVIMVPVGCLVFLVVHEIRRD